MLHDKVEILLRAFFFQQIDKFLPHFLNPRTHFVQFCHPLRFQFGILQHHGHRIAAVRCRIGIQRANDGFDLAEGAVGRIRIGGHHGKRTHALVIHAEVFRIRAGHQQFFIQLGKSAQAVSILFQTVRKALIGKVEQRQPAFFRRHFRQCFPLFGSRVDAGRIVAAAVQQHHVAGFGLGQIGNQAVPIQAVRCFVVITVIADIDADGFENGIVVRPGRSGNPHVFRTGLTFDKLGGDAQRARTAQALRGFGALGRDDFAVRAKQQFLRFGVVGGHTVDGQIVFAVFIGQQAGFGFLHRFRNRGIAFSVFVNTDAQVHLIAAGFGFECFAQTQNRVGRRSFDFIEKHDTSFLF